MLPFSTYNIPESTKKKTDESAKWLAIIISKPLSAQNEDLLQKICSAINADFSTDTMLIQADSEQNISLSSVIHPGIKMVISFGIKPSQLGVWIDLNSPGVRFLESFCFILTTPPDELSQNASAKKQLWQSMQTFLATKD